jgi:multiple sugar transport system ATP-binding protein
MIAGLETATGGNILIGNKRVNDLPPQKRDVAMVFQNYALYPHMRVYDNLATPLRIRHIPKNEIDKKVREVAELLRIDELLQRKPSELSGGQRQRVALGRATVREPVAFLMDEPLSNLDAKLRIYMRAELKRLHRKLGTTTIYVTHDQEEAMTLGERIAVINYGVLQQFGAPEDIYRHPSNLFVAGFIGSPSMNMIPGYVMEENGQVKITTDIFTCLLPSHLPSLRTRTSRSEVVVGIRPFDLKITDTREQNTFEAEVDVVEPLGQVYNISLLTHGQVVTIVTPQNRAFRTGEEVSVEYDAKSLFVYDKGDGKLIDLVASREKMLDA